MKLGPIILFEKFTIQDGTGDPYLIRWRLVDSPWFGIYLHKIIRSDHDRHLHDHPFDFVSIMLRGCYLEYLRGRVLPLSRAAVSVAFRRAEQAHRLEVSAPCWTLVARGARRRSWGFYVDDGWVRSDEYLQEESEQAEAM